MMKLKTLKVVACSLFIGALASCSSDDDAVAIPEPEVVVTPSAGDILLASIATDGGVPYNAENPALTFEADENVFIPSVLGLDYRVDRSVVPAGPTVRLPLFQGWETTAPGVVRPGYYIITEASDRDLATQLGVIYAPRMANAIGSEGTQDSEWSEDGRLVFDGSVDFSGTRSLTVGGVSDDGLLAGFATDGFTVTPGATADDEWSSYVILPGTDIVINAQLMANETGIHDRIPNPEGNEEIHEDDLNNPNLAIDQASVVLQLLDGWQDGRPNYFHIVTDTSNPGPATIELGVYAPKLANLPTFGEFPGGSMLPFSPTANGRTTANEDGFGVQGLNAAVLSDRQVQDPTNTFPIDPSDVTYAPMWDAHVTEFTIAEADRPILRSFDQINDLLANGTLIPFRGNPITVAGDNPLENSLSEFLTPSNLIINCPVVSQPLDSALGRIIGQPTNN